MTLSDLTTSNIGFIGYWNAENNGSGEVDPTDVLSHNSIQSYTQESNGVEGIYSHTVGNGRSTFHSRDFNFRVKTDGWFIVYFDRTNNYGTNQSGDTLNNYMDIVQNWADDDNNISTFPVTCHSNIINSLFSQLSNSDQFSFAHADVDHYNYEYTSATTMTEMDEYEGGNIANFNGGLSYASGTTRHFHTVAAAQHGFDNDERGNLEFGGTLVVHDDADAGLRNVIGTNTMPSADTVYRHDYAGGSNDTGDAHANMSHIILWS